MGDGPEPLHAFLMVLSYSRKPAVVWTRSENLLGWLTAHNEALRRLGGVPAVNRIDNVKTAIMRGAGPWGIVHPAYKAYADHVGFHVDPCLPRAANAKGKVEAKVRLTRLRVDPRGRYDGLDDLQARSDKRMDDWTRKAICPATGKTVHETWLEELESLSPLGDLPDPFDVAVTRRVHRDCHVNFEGRSYAVPFAFVGRQVEVRGCLETVQILCDGQTLREYPRRSARRIWTDQSCYEGEATDRALPPPPLGHLGRRMQEIYEMPVEQRPLDLYAALTEAAR